MAPKTKNNFRLAVFLFTALVLLGRGVSLAAAESQVKWDKKRWGPVVPHKTFPKDCATCHQTTRWSDVKKDLHFDHLKETGFALVGPHARAYCLRCHNDRGPVKMYVARGCSGCHVDPHKGTMGLVCTRCHDAKQMFWSVPAITSDHARTRFPLSGRHLLLNCEQCHTQAAAGNYKGLSPQCNSCHASDYAQAPGHVAKNFPTTCTNCHNTNNWVAAHSNRPDCYSCHADNYARALNHQAQGYPRNCATSCHNNTTFSRAPFTHAPIRNNQGESAPINHYSFNCVQCHTSYQTTSHSCTNCHQSPSWENANMDHSGLTACINCHAKDFPRGPNHSTAKGFPTTCNTCHTPTVWSAAVMNHSGLTNCYQCHADKFLTGGGPKHNLPGFPTTCSNCHTPTAWSNAVMNHTGLTDCYACHSDRYAAQANHVKANFPHNCTLCHAGAPAWSNVKMNHAAAGFTTNCIGCHMENYRGAPNHVARQFPYDCNTSCHNTNGFPRGPFVHTPLIKNGIPAPDSHTTGNCTMCHRTFLTTYQDCGNCHAR